jgi:hypothetical protein
MRMLPAIVVVATASVASAQVFQSATPGLYQQTLVEQSFLAALSTAPQLVTFEELPLGPVASDQYAALGLTINTTAPAAPLNAGDGAPTIGATGAFSAAHSGVNSLFAGPQGTAENYTLVFDPPATAVSFWIIDQEVNQSAFDRIKLYDANGALLLDVSNLTNGYTTVELGVQGNMFFGYVATGAPVATVRIIEKLTDNDGAGLDDVRWVTPGAATLPGTADGLVLATAVGATPPAVAPFDVKDALPGQTVTLRTSSLVAAYYGAPVVLAAELFVTGGAVPSAASLGLPQVHVTLAPTTFYLLGGPTAFFMPVLLPPSSDFAFVVPPGLSGFSATAQSFVASPVAANFVFAASDAHEIRFL